MGCGRGFDLMALVWWMFHGFWVGGIGFGRFCFWVCGFVIFVFLGGLIVVFELITGAVSCGFSLGGWFCRWCGFGILDLNFRAVAGL